MESRKIANYSAALDGLSLEIGVHDLKALANHSDVLADDSQVYVNAVAGAGTDARVKTAEQLSQLGYRPVAHIAARRMVSADALDDYLGRLVKRAGVEDVLVIGGDIAKPLGPFESALDVIESGVLTTHGIKRIGVAGYPDGHPGVAQSVLRDALEGKIAACRIAGIEPYIVTQFSFQAASIITWCHAFHARHPTIAVHAGIPGPAKLATLMRFAKICGVQSSAKKLLANKKVGLDLLRGTAPWEQLDGIGAYKLETGLALTTHIFTFGGLEEVTKWLDDVRAGDNGTDVFRI